LTATIAEHFSHFGDATLVSRVRVFFAAGIVDHAGLLDLARAESFASGVVQLQCAARVLAACAFSACAWLVYAAKSPIVTRCAHASLRGGDAIECLKRRRI
jgi:hypothetical protein